MPLFLSIPSPPPRVGMVPRAYSARTALPEPRGDSGAAARSARCGIVLACVIFSRPVAGQTDAQRAGARAAATAGAQAFTEQRWGKAADLFARAEGVVHSPVQLVYLARSYEKLGQLVKAREAYLKVVNETVAPNAPAPWRDAKTDAQAEDAALEPRIPYVTIEIAGVPTARVTMDGVEVLSAFIGVPQPVDPGDHEFKAARQGKASATAKVSLAEGERETVVLTLATGGAPMAGAVGPAETHAQVRAVISSALASDVDAGRGVSPLTWAVLGVGAIGLGVGTIFALKTSSELDEANGLCDIPTSSGARACPDNKRSQIEALDDSARSAKTLAIVGFVAGGIGIGTAATLLVLSSTERARSSRSQLQPWVGLGSAGLRGRF